jgi:hypothetical protein
LICPGLSIVRTFHKEIFYLIIVENDPLTKISLMKTLKELFVLIAGICLLAACTKIEDKGISPLSEAQKSKVNVLKIDLTAPAYKALNEVGGSVVFSSEGIIVGKTASDTPDQTFVAADYKCPCCDAQLGFSTNISTSEAWVCRSCQIKFDAYGFVLCGSSNIPLETHPVTQSGDILTVFY